MYVPGRQEQENITSQKQGGIVVGKRSTVQRVTRLGYLAAASTQCMPKVLGPGQIPDLGTMLCTEFLQSRGYALS